MRESYYYRENISRTGFEVVDRSTGRVMDTTETETEAIAMARELTICAIRESRGLGARMPVIATGNGIDISPESWQ